MYQQAMMQDPKNPQIRINLGRLYLEQGDFQKAEANFSKVLENDPQNLAAVYGQAQIFIQKKEFQKAIDQYEQLAEKDPEAARHIHPNNVRYVIRALEINLSGNINKQDQKGEQQFSVFSVGIDWPREDLYDRIHRRIDSQVDRGVINEVKTLLMKGYNETLPAMSSLGYLELMAYVKGETDLQTALENFKKNTRNYAKRQITWFRRYKEIRWITPSELEEIVNNNF